MENHYFQWINHDNSTIHGNFPVRKLLVYQAGYTFWRLQKNDSDHVKQ